MKRIGFFVASIFIYLCIQVSPAHSLPLDLSGFSGDATESGGTITFINDGLQQFYAFSNPSFYVPDDAGILSFDYSLDLVPDNGVDYLTFEITFSALSTIMNEGSGNIALDISSYQGETVDFAWVLYWGGIMNAGETRATVSKIDLATDDGHNVPEPATIVLVLAGLVGLPFFCRKKS